MGRDAANELYRALANRDVDQLIALVHPNFTGTISDGLPIDTTGGITGSDTLITRVWGAVSVDFDVAPQPEEIIRLDDGRILALGRYRGTARRTGRHVDAMFAHVLTFADGRLIGLDQYTDTHRWQQALHA